MIDSLRSPWRSLLVSVAMLAAVAGNAPAQEQPAPPVWTPGGFRGGYLVFQNADSSFQYWLDGRVQVDAALYRGNDNELGSGTDIRRARLGGKITLYRLWHGEIDVDFAENAVDMKDMWIGYMGFHNSIVRVGQFREPFSLETITSSKFITFMERSYLDNFSPDRRVGLGASVWGGRWFASAGVFGQEAGTVDESGQGEAHAFTGRLVWAPINRDGRLVHLGVGLSYRTPDAETGNDTSSVRFRARPETWVSKARFLSTGRIRGTDHAEYGNIEFAATRGPALLQAEYTEVHVSRQASLPSPKFNAGYVTVSYMLTGEHRPYVIQQGEFERIIPRSNKTGAWEVAARWSYMDLNDLRTGVDIDGGRAENVTVGLNWHMNPNFKWMLNYVRVDNDGNALPDIGEDPVTPSDKFHIIQMRFALAF